MFLWLKRKNMKFWKMVQIFLTVNMKIIHGKKNIKRYTRKENGKWKTFIVKEKSPDYLSGPKIFYNCKFNLFQFCHVWIKPLSHQAWSKNLQSLEYCCRRAFLFLFWRISLTKFSINLISISFQILTPRVLNPNKLWCLWASSI